VQLKGAAEGAVDEAPAPDGDKADDAGSDGSGGGDNGGGGGTAAQPVKGKRAAKSTTGVGKGATSG